jgi:NAD(P)-dependent dehydrogenase (short-subunit alcohol dehydrogenase family)
MDLGLTGRVAVVTGGSRGIGKAIALELAREGVDVAVVARGAEALEASAREIAAATGRRVLPLAADTTDDASVAAMAARALSEFGRVDILVNCAARVAGGRPPALEGVTSALFFEELNTKVMGYLRCAQAFAPSMRASGWGRIINVSGLAARQSGSIVGSIRNVSVAALTKNLADELGPHGINVTVVHPGMTVTEATPQSALDRIAEGNSVRRAITAADIASVVAFLASPRSVAINGDAIAAGGGVGRAIHY